MKSLSAVLALALHAHQEEVFAGHEKLSESHYQKWLPVCRRAAALASIYESPRQDVDQIRRRPEVRPSSKTQTKKPALSVSNGLQPEGRNGLEIAKAGLSL